ncbi:LysR family transcriptional regulator [Roseibium sp. AS2]|uniref:LysR family transcriptional regulator n=1 Tax=Roseibium sp. AS2 TaxID=3135781 RepID=UPI00317BA486
MDNWDDLKFVLAIAKAGNVTRAARTLSVTHSTVSRRLSALEDRLGTRLFDRLPDGFRPTAAGDLAVLAATRMAAELVDLDTRMTARDADLEGPLRVTAAQLIYQVQLADIVARFKEQHPQIDVTMNAANEILSLHRREADIAVRVTDKPDETLFGRRATGQNRCFYVSREFARRHGDALVETATSRRVPFVAFKWWGNKVPKELRARFPNGEVATVTDDMVTKHAAVRAAMGIGRLPCFLGDMDPDLIRLPGVEPSRYFDIWILTHPDLRNVARIRAFLRFAADAYKARSGLYLGE